MLEDDDTGIIDEHSDAVSAMGITTSKGTQSPNSSYFPVAGVLDSDTTATRLPQSLFNVFASYFGASDPSTYLVNCSLASEAITIDYQFGGTGGPIIQLPVEEIVLPALDHNGKQGTDKGVPICLFGILPTPDDGSIFVGDTLIHSAYVVYDLDLETIWIAPAKFDGTTSNGVEIDSNSFVDSAGVASSSAARSAVTVSNSTTRTLQLAPGTIGVGSITSSV